MLSKIEENFQAVVGFYFFPQAVGEEAFEIYQHSS